MLKVGINIYISFSIATLIVLILSYFANKNYIFYTKNTNHLVIFTKYLIVFFLYLITSYAILFCFSETALPENIYALLVSIILFYPNYAITKYVFK